MKYKKGDNVQLTNEAKKEWEEGGYFDGHGYVFRADHTVSHYNGTTLFTTEMLGFKDADNVLELVSKGGGE